MIEKISEFLYTWADKWHYRSSLPKIIKEFIFLFVVVAATLMMELSDWMKGEK